MLVERVFLIGGVLSVVLGGVWVAGGAIVARATGDLTDVLGGTLLIGFGVFFAHVGREARRDRERMLREALDTR